MQWCQNDKKMVKNTLAHIFIPIHGHPYGHERVYLGYFEVFETYRVQYFQCLWANFDHF